jgi:hypothetical protein
MRILARHTFIFILLLIFSCEEQGLMFNCKDCISEEPLDVSLDVRLNRLNADPYIAEVKIYEGNLEDSILRSKHYVYVNDLFVKVNINKKYTLTATYIDSNGSKYVAVDSATPRVRFEADLCDKPCYFVYDKRVNLKLKYIGK